MQRVSTKLFAVSAQYNKHSYSRIARRCFYRENVTIMARRASNAIMQLLKLMYSRSGPDVVCDERQAPQQQRKQWPIHTYGAITTVHIVTHTRAWTDGLIGWCVFWGRVIGRPPAKSPFGWVFRSVDSMPPSIVIELKLSLNVKSPAETVSLVQAVMCLCRRTDRDYWQCVRESHEVKVGYEWF